MLEEKLRELRKSRGLTQKEVGERLLLSQVSYGRFELGKRRLTEKHLRTLSEFYNVSLDYLLGKPERNIVKLIDFLNILTSRNENLDVKIYCFEPDIEIKPSTFIEGKLLFSTFDLCLTDDYWFRFKNLKDDIISETWIWHNREVVLVDTYPRNRVNGEWWLIAIR